ncbi:MAG: cadherin-like domain-containing protein, partial [Thermoanaerobaculia bacterium]
MLLICPPASAQCNANPVAAADAVVYSGGPVLVVDVLANDVEPDGEALTIDNLSTTCTGTVSEDLGLVTLTVTGFSGDCTIGYRINDESGGSDSATVSILDGTEVFVDGFETGDPVGPNLSYGLTLSYSSNGWDYEDAECFDIDQGVTVDY